MYRVLIVDDEAIICQGLRSTVEWDCLGLELCGEAHNGNDALAMVRQMQPNILITDIRMPGMDGMTLIKTIREENLPVKIIILSGYSDYAFLKGAIRMGVDGYLLKPIDLDELLSNLSDLVHTIENEQLRSSQLYQGMELLRSNTLHRLVTNTIGLREFEEKASFLGIALEGDCFICAVCSISSSGSMDDRTMQTVLRIVNHALPPKAGVAFLDVGQRVVLLLYGDTGDQLYAAMAKAMDTVIQQVRDTLQLQLTCGKGIPVLSIEDIWKSYAVAAERFQLQPDTLDADSSDGKGNPLVNRALAYIAAHYGESISLKQLAGILEINTSYLGQLFKKQTGESFTSYVNQYRIQRAKELLMATNQKVYEVAQDVGFTDYHYFLIIFKKLTGINPTDIRS